MLLQGEHLEPLSRDVSVIVSREYGFTTDTLLLADFSLPRWGERCAELGTGCGVIPLLWCIRSRPAAVYAWELQSEACSMARRSAEAGGFGGVIKILHEDLRGAAELRRTRRELQNLDLVCCNPPYQAGGTGFQNPELSRRIARHEEECSLSDAVAAAAALLRTGGRFCLCHRPERLCDVLWEMRDKGVEAKRLRFVQQRKEKKPFLFLVQGIRGGRPGLTAEPPLLLEEDGVLSREAAEIYGEYREGAT